MKKKAVLAAAKKLFGEKGYDDVAMDEIARESGVSKGTIYKYFSSKEELLIGIASGVMEDIKQRFIQVSLNEEYVLKEKITEMIYAEIQEIFKNKKFSFMILTEMFNNDDSDVYRAYKNIGVQLADWAKVILDPCYGKRVEPYIWDILLIIYGVMRQYLDLAIKSDLKLDERYFAKYLTDIIDTIIVGMIDNENEPLITAEMLNIDNSIVLGGATDNVNKINEVLVEIEAKIKMLPKGYRAEDGLMEAFQHLKKEIVEKKGGENNYLIKALLSYLKEDQSLTGLCIMLEEYIFSMY